MPVAESQLAVFPGFDPEDLDLFRRHAWTDPERTEARARALGRLEALAAAPLADFSARFPELGLEILRSSPEPGPGNEGRVEAAYVGLVRNAAHRRAARREAERMRCLKGIARLEAFWRHPSIFLRVRPEGLLLAASLPRAAVPDAPIFLKKVGERSWRQALLGELRALPEGFLLGDGLDAMLPTASLTPAVLRMATEAFDRGVGWLVTGRRWTREQLLDQPSMLELDLPAAVAPLASIYRRLAHVPTPGDLGVSTRGLRARGQRDGQRRGPGKGGRRAKVPQKGRRKDGPAPQEPLDRPPVVGDRVRISSGPFAGRVGAVLDLRSGQAQVRFRQLPVWVDVAEVAVLPPVAPSGSPPKPRG